MSPRLSLFITALILVLGATVTFATAPSLSPQPIAQQSADPTIERGQRGWLRQLNLTPEQLKQIRTIRGRYKAQLEETRQAVRQARQELQTLMRSSASTEEIRKKFDQIQPLRQELMRIQFNSLLEIRSILTVEQRQKIGDIQQRRHGNVRNRLRERLDEEL
ncbi:Spy/CpxP family protein refolding chaperone [Pantanalinema sp. GBBB05]|uniref:Spy/CpxP family protein refolding chaperone n=1 Tax=Pantanalinema sp. GBBB05 TaxID=2604139 RepID=UPI001D36E5BA|nr:periplasmic heavy metal sensor [Pantanalinema sp. GBBB05]